MLGWYTLFIKPIDRRRFEGVVLGQVNPHLPYSTLVRRCNVMRVYLASVVSGKQYNNINNIISRYNKYIIRLLDAHQPLSSEIILKESKKPKAINAVVPSMGKGSSSTGSQVSRQTEYCSGDIQARLSKLQVQLSMISQHQRKSKGMPVTHDRFEETGTFNGKTPQKRVILSRRKNGRETNERKAAFIIHRENQSKSEARDVFRSKLT